MLECSYWNFLGARVVIKIPVQKIEKVIYEEKNRRIRLCGAMRFSHYEDYKEPEKSVYDCKDLDIIKELNCTN